MMSYSRTWTPRSSASRRAPLVGHGIEAHHQRVFRRRQCELHVVLGNAADAREQHADAHLLVGQFLQFLIASIEPRKSAFG
jgi:hypothetical protein